MEVSRTVKCAGYWDALVLGTILEEQGVQVRRPDEVAPVTMVATGALDTIKAAVAQLRHEYPNCGPIIIEGEDADDGAPEPPRPLSAREPSPAPEPPRRPAPVRSLQVPAMLSGFGDFVMRSGELWHP